MLSITMPPQKFDPAIRFTRKNQDIHNICMHKTGQNLITAPVYEHQRVQPIVVVTNTNKTEIQTQEKQLTIDE